MNKVSDRKVFHEIADLRKMSLFIPLEKPRKRIV